MKQEFYDKHSYSADACKDCGKLKSPQDIYFCSGCGFGTFGDEEFTWEEVTLQATLRN